MAELSTFARPYAEALFCLALDSGSLAEWASRLAVMAQVAAHPDLRMLAADPNVSAEKLYELLTDVLGPDLGTEPKNLLRVLIDNDRLGVVAEIHRQFEAMKNAHEGAADAEVVTAFPLSEEQLRELMAAMEKKFGVRLKPQVRVEQGLIGGVRVTVGDRTLDASMRAQLERMQVALTA